MEAGASRNVKFIVLGDVASSAVPPDAGPAGRVDAAPSLFDEEGRMDVDETVRAFEPPRGRPESVVVLTSHDLARRGCRSLFGFSDRSRHVAVVSTFRLAETPERLRARVANVVAHELAHLGGLKHCRVPGCLMHPVTLPAEIDGRAVIPCGRCPRRGGRLPRPAAGAIAAGCVMLLFAGVDQLAVWYRNHSNRVFECKTVVAAGAGDAPGLFFKGQPLLVERDHGSPMPIPGRTAATADLLNRLFAELNPPQLTVVQREPDGAAIVAGKTELLKIGAGDAVGEDPLVLARRCSNELENLLRAKGRSSELCAACHLNRAGEVREAANRRKWNWKRN